MDCVNSKKKAYIHSLRESSSKTSPNRYSNESNKKLRIQEIRSRLSPSNPASLERAELKKAQLTRHFAELGLFEAKKNLDISLNNIISQLPELVNEFVAKNNELALRKALAARYGDDEQIVFLDGWTVKEFNEFARIMDEYYNTTNKHDKRAVGSSVFQMLIEMDEDPYIIELMIIAELGQRSVNNGYMLAMAAQNEAVDWIEENADEYHAMTVDPQLEKLGVTYE